MELIAIAPKGLLHQKDWSIIENNFNSITFVNAKQISTFDYNKTDKEKTLLLDPDYFDWNLPKDIFSKIGNLKYVCLTTTTASYIDEEYLAQNGIKLLTIPKYSTSSVAEYLVFLMMCLAKKLPLQLKNNCKQDFSDKYLQIELTGKTVGVVGLGSIGNKICEITSGMGMNATYWNRTKKETKYQFCELEDLFKNSDIIFITLANNPTTKKIVSDKLLKSMKSTAILISGTGIALHNDKVVRQMLKENKLYGFGAELPDGSYKDYDGNAMITSEYAWFTEEATKRRIKILVENLLSIK